MRALAVVSLLIALAAAGCEDSSGPATPSLTGRFVGATTGVQADLNLTETGGNVTGNGTIVAPNPANVLQSLTIPVTVTGTHAHPNVTLTARATGQPDATFTGAFQDANTVTGSLSLPGFPTVSLTLTRQP